MLKVVLVFRATLVAALMAALLGVIVVQCHTSFAAHTPHVDVLVVDGVVNPVLADYIDRGIDGAEEGRAEACIIELDTPGGLLSSTEDIVRRISEASVPIVVYVPRGSWAASAGAFVTLAADVAAMGPESVIGASTPIAGGEGELSEDERNKAVRLASQWITSIAEEHGRNKEAASIAVTQAASFSPGEALGISDLSSDNSELLGGVQRLDPPLIDAIANSIEELVEMLGEGIILANEEEFSLPAGASLNYVKMSTGEGFLYAISDPNIAYILLSLAMLGIMVELFHPGVIIPGTVGVICLLLSLYSLDTLEANYAGVLLMVVALGLFIAEVFTATFGVLTAGGIVCLIIGSLILFSGSPFEVDRGLVASVVIVVAGMFIFLVVAVVRSQRRPLTTGREALIGGTAVSRTILDPDGVVFIHGERWNARSEDDRIEMGEEVKVTKVERLRLWVIRRSD